MVEFLWFIIDLVILGLFFWYCEIPVHPAEQERREQVAADASYKKLCDAIRKAGKL